MFKKLSFFMLAIFIPANVFAATVLPSFGDLNSNTPYMDAIYWTVSAGITQGYSNGNWGPDDCVTRAELLKMMIEYHFRATGGFESIIPTLEGDSGVSDVHNNDWFFNYVRYAKNLHIVEGYADGTFQPNSCVNRVEAMKIAVKSMVPNQELPGGASPLYYDDKIISDMYGVDWYAPYARFLFQNRLIGSQHTQFDSEVGNVGGHNTIKFFPADPMTRKEVAYLMMQIGENYQFEI